MGGVVKKLNKQMNKKEVLESQLISFLANRMTKDEVAYAINKINEYAQQVGGDQDEAYSIGYEVGYAAGLKENQC